MHSNFPIGLELQITAMPNLLKVALSVSLFLQAAAVADHHLQEQALSDKYQFSHQLHDRYTLYWTYDPAAEEVSFAVFVQTTGWIGFGLSPTGQMPGSDVVIGWVDNDGRSHFDDRFASVRATPAIDEQQNWILVNAMEDDGYTTLEFKRGYISCDPDYDLNIEPNTARVVWSFKEEDPANGADGAFDAHDFQGSVSLNLLGGFLDRPDVPDTTEYFEVLVEDVHIPTAATTYWCSSFRLPDPVMNQEKYIIKISPSLSEASSAHAHHMLVHMCAGITDPPNPAGTQCNDAPRDIRECLSNKLIAAWTVGGEDFIFPDNVALPIGGADSNYQYIVMQVHYDNPNGISGVVDNSGMRFYYSSVARQYDAGIMKIGHNIVTEMIIPPKASNYTVLGLCPTGCTKNFPDDGITIFANLLHTHLLGVGLELLHLREEEDCNGVRELKPIDRNLRYDFDYQNAVYLDNIVVQKGDILLLRCIYDSTGRERVTFGGEGVTDEMCLSFITYYPAVGIIDCLSQFDPSSINPFINRYIGVEDRASFGSSLNRFEYRQDLTSVLNTLDWTNEEIQVFQKMVTNTVQYSTCIFTEEYAQELGLDNRYNVTVGPHVKITCEYEEPRAEKDCSDGPRSVIIATAGGSQATICFSIALLLIAASIITAA